MNLVLRLLLIFVIFITLTPLTFAQESSDYNYFEFKQKNLKRYGQFLRHQTSYKSKYDKRWVNDHGISIGTKLVSILQLPNESMDRKIELKTSRQANGANFRIIDKIYGTNEEIVVFKSSIFEYDSLIIRLDDCFYDIENLQDGSLALLNILDKGPSPAAFDGWMSSRYSHVTYYNNYRYSLWLLSCIISDQE